jgi:hypothetical protein
MPGVMSRTWRRDTGDLVSHWVSGEPDALKGASPVWIHEWLRVRVVSPLPELLNFIGSGVFILGKTNMKENSVRVRGYYDEEALQRL